MVSGMGQKGQHPWEGGGVLGGQAGSGCSQEVEVTVTQSLRV